MRGMWSCLALVTVVALGACGGSSRAENASSSDRATGESGTTSTTTSTSTTQKSTSKAEGEAGKGKAANGSTTSTTASTSGSKSSKAAEDPMPRKLDIQVELAEQCVRPGGSQTIVVRTMPFAGVGYDTVYSDGLSGLMEGHYGGNMVGFTNPEGMWTHTWTIGPNAPAGPVRVNVLGTHEEGGQGEAYSSFTVADVLGKC